MPPLVTIGLPVWNAAPFLRETLKAILAQTETDWELLIVDDGSTDGSQAIAGSLSDARARFLEDGKHLGLAARLNQIAATATGQFLARMDADDLMHPQRLEKQLRRLKGEPSCDVVGCGMLILDKKGQPAGARRLPKSHEEIVSDVLRQMKLAHATAMAPTEWWRKFRYDETAPLGVEDWRFWIEAAPKSRFANVPELLYYYREFDSFRLGNYLRNKQGLIARLWQMEQVPLASAALETAKHALRAIVFASASVLGRAGSLISRRNQPLTPEEVRDFTAAIAEIEAVKLECPQPSL